MIKLKDLLTEALAKDRIVVTNRKTGKEYEVTKGYYDHHKEEYTIPKDKSKQINTPQPDAKPIPKEKNKSLNPKKLKSKQIKNKQRTELNSLQNSIQNIEGGATYMSADMSDMGVVIDVKNFNDKTKKQIQKIIKNQNYSPKGQWSKSHAYGMDVMKLSLSKSDSASKSPAKQMTGKITSDDLDKQVKSLMKDIVLPKKSLAKISSIDRQKISMKIDQLAKLADQAKAKGQNAPNYNLCKITIPGTNLYCQGNKGVPRAQMPQFKGTPSKGSVADKLPKDKDGEVDTEEFFKKMLAKQGINVSQPAQVPADRLKATQAQLVGAKVAGMSRVLADPKHPAYSKITAPIYVSNDGYVLDGHHRWAAIVAHNVKNPKEQIPMNVRIIDQNIVPLVKSANKFAQDIGIKPKAATTGKAGG